MNLLLAIGILMLGASLGVVAFAFVLAAREDRPPRNYLLGRCGSCQEPVWESEEYRVIHQSCPRGGSGKPSAPWKIEPERPWPGPPGDLESA